MCFSVNFREDDEPIVIDPNGRIVSFKSLVDVDSYGRCKLSIEGQVKSSIFYYATSTNVYKIYLTNILQNTYAICLSLSYTRFV